MSTNSNTPYVLPPLGQNPSSTAAGTTPGSFAKKGQIAPGVDGRWTFASPDTPGMPEPSEKTAWDFMPEGWGTERFTIPNREMPFRRTGHYLPGSTTADITEFNEADGTTRAVMHPKGFVPSTQLEHARLGIITPEMKRVAEREGHLTPEQVLSLIHI